ncbi:MAG: hypothetical protein JW940_12670 [Polyangiaceae bacterium]|nr:hypothetical protein [Polyangiaceae bacterium]
MTQEQVKAAAEFHESAMATLANRYASPAEVRAAVWILMCHSLVNLESLAELVRQWLADSRTSPRMAQRFARQSRQAQELIAYYRGMLNMPPAGAQA